MVVEERPVVEGAHEVGNVGGHAALCKARGRGGKGVDVQVQNEIGTTSKQAMHSTSGHGGAEGQEGGLGRGMNGEEGAAKKGMAIQRMERQRGH